MLAVASLVALLGAVPVGPNVAMKDKGVRVTLLSVQQMNAAELKGAAGGRVVQWLIEPEEGWPSPVFGDVRLIVEGKLFNPVVNATSSKPGAPDLIIDDARKLGFGADPLGGTVLSPQAVIVTVLIRGEALATDALIETSIQLGLWPRGAKPKAGMKPRYVEFRAQP